MDATTLLTFNVSKFQSSFQRTTILREFIEKIKTEKNNISVLHTLLAELVGHVSSSLSLWKADRLMFVTVRSIVKDAFDDLEDKISFDSSKEGTSRMSDYIRVNIEQIYIFLEIKASVEIKMDTSKDAKEALKLYKKLNEGVEDLNRSANSINKVEEEEILQEVLMTIMGLNLKINVDLEEKIEKALQEAKLSTEKAKEELRRAEENCKLREVRKKSLLVEYERKIKEVKMTEEEIEALREELRKLNHFFSDEEFEDEDDVLYLSD
jgi:hypothetical protein